MKSNIANNHISVTASDHPLHKDITLLSVKGFIDTTTAPEFEKTFQTVLAQKKFNIIIDLKDVTYVSSAGWGIFVGEIKRIRSQKGNLFLVGMTPEVTDAYELLQFETIIKSFPNLQEAVQKGFGKPNAGKGAPAKAVGKGLEPPSAEKDPGPPAKTGGPVAQTSSPGPRKRRSLFRLFLPWKWF